MEKNLSRETTKKRLLFNAMGKFDVGNIIQRQLFDLDPEQCSLKIRYIRHTKKGLHVAGLYY